MPCCSSRAVSFGRDVLTLLSKSFQAELIYIHGSVAVSRGIAGPRFLGPFQMKCLILKRKSMLFPEAEDGWAQQNAVTHMHLFSEGRNQSCFLFQPCPSRGGGDLPGCSNLFGCSKHIVRKRLYLSHLKLGNEETHSSIHLYRFALTNQR